MTGPEQAQDEEVAYYALRRNKSSPSPPPKAKRRLRPVEKPLNGEVLDEEEELFQLADSKVILYDTIPPPRKNTTSATTGGEWRNWSKTARS